MAFVNENWVQIISLIAMIVWSIRLEGKVLNQEKEIQAVTRIMGKLSEIAERLSYIEGSIKGRNV